MLAVVAAFKEEINDYLKSGGFRVAERGEFLRFYRSSRATNVVVAVGGVGKQRAQAAAKQLIESYSPECVLSVGFAGGVQSGLKPGDLFICDRLMSIEGPAAFWRVDNSQELPPLPVTSLDMLTWDAEESRQKYAYCGCLTIPQFASSSSIKAWLGDVFPVSIIDMESYWVAETAISYGIPHAVVRSVLDPVDETLPPFITETVGDGGVRTWERALKYVVTKPTRAPKLINLASRVKTAGASLSDLLADLVSKKS